MTDTIDPITTEEYFRGTLKVIAHWSEVDLSGEWETGLRGVIRSITDMAREILSAHPEKPTTGNDTLIQQLREIATEFAIDNKTDCKQHVCWIAADRLSQPGAALAKPTTVAADLDSGGARPNRELDSPDRGQCSSAGTASAPMTREYVLRAMARNYAPGNSWDRLDAEACIQAADEIKTLREWKDAHAPAQAEPERLPTYGDLLADINKAAHSAGTNAWVRDVLKRAHRAIRLNAPLVSSTDQAGGK